MIGTIEEAIEKAKKEQKKEENNTDADKKETAKV